MVMKSVVQSPLQLSTFFLAWVESSLVASLWSRVDGSARTAIIAVVLAIAVLTAIAVNTVLLRLSKNNPALLHDISQWGDTAQKLALEYDRSGKELTLTAPPTANLPLEGGVSFEGRDSAK